MNESSIIDKPLYAEFKTPIGKVRVVRTNYRIGMPCDLCALQEKKSYCRKYACAGQKRIDGIPVYFEKI